MTAYVWLILLAIAAMLVLAVVGHVSTRRIEEEHRRACAIWDDYAAGKIGEAEAVRRLEGRR